MVWSAEFTAFETMSRSANIRRAADHGVSAKAAPSDEGKEGRGKDGFHGCSCLVDPELVPEVQEDTGLVRLEFQSRL